jgi:hypothetical protein
VFLFEQRAAISIAGVWGFEHVPFICYPIENALLENMICPHSCPPIWTKPLPFIGSNQNQLPLPGELPEMVVSIDSPRKCP